MSKVIDKIVFSGIIFVLIFTQLAFGGVHVWAYSVFEIIVLILFFLFLLNQVVGQYRSSKRKGKKAVVTIQWVVTPLNIFFILIISFIVIQLIPLPSFIVKFISPLTFELKKYAYELKHVSNNDSIAWMNLSHYNFATCNELFKLLAYAALYFMVINSVRDQKRINILIYVFVGMGLFQVMYGIVQTYSGSQKIWWWTNNYYKGWVTGTYINRNHLAGFLEMLLPLCFGFVIANIKKSGSRQRYQDRSVSRIRRFKNWLFSGEEKPKIILFFFMGIVLGLGLLLAGSRGGIISFGISMFFMIFLFAFKDGYRKYGIVTACLCMLIMAYGLHIGIDKTLERFEHFGNLYNRFEIGESVVPMIKDFPILGTGWGNFMYMYPRYGLPMYSDRLILGNAHNDWLEMASEFGMIGAIIFFGALITFLVKSIRLWFRRKDSFATGLGVGVIFAVIAISIHSFFDFNMHIPANPMALSIILAVGFLSLHIDRHSNYDRFFFKTKSVSLNSRFPLIVIVIFVILSGFFMLNKITGHFAAEAYCSTELNSTLNRDRNPPLEDIKKAIEYDPSNAEYYYNIAHYYMRLPFETEELRIEHNEEIITNLEKAVLLNPVNGIYWYDLGVSYSFKGYEGNIYYSEWLPGVDKAFQMAEYLRPNDSSLLYKTALYWVFRSSRLPDEEGRDQRSEVAKGQKVRPARNALACEAGGGRRSERDRGRRSEVGGHPSEMRFAVTASISQGREGSGQLTREDGIRKFQELFKRSLKLNRRDWKKAVERVWEYYPDEKIVMGVIPKDDKGLSLKVKEWMLEKQGSDRETDFNQDQIEIIRRSP
jgi:O-antigen ligase